MTPRRLAHALLVSATLLLTHGLTWAVLPAKAIPEPLKTWVPWALDGAETSLCPLLVNGTNTGRCAWPGRLDLQTNDQGAAFTQDWTVYRESWITLPGDARHWPQDVTVDGKPVAVIAREDRPILKLSEGEHRVAGRFVWNGIPESLALPADAGLLRLDLSGRVVPHPVRDETNTLWLQRKQDAEGEDEARVRVYRKITDGVPLLVETRLRIDVSGRNREIELGRALLPNMIPQEIVSPLPTVLAKDGSLKVQARAGSWEITFIARQPAPAQAFSLPPEQGLSAAEEIWVFEAAPLIRTTSIIDAPSVDPQQTTLPDEWRSLPSYLMRVDTRFGIKEIRRGDSEPAPDKLALNRRLWLSFDGSAVTVSDQIHGEISRASRLAMLAPAALGRVDLNGNDQLITRDTNGQAGVEVKRGQLQLNADSLMTGSPRRFAAVGWQHDFDQVSATLALPPGWRLLHAQGADRADGEWLLRWNLLDFFIVLIIALAVGQLYGPSWGAVALLGLAVAYQEPGAPGLVWLAPLAAIALYRVLPDGRFRTTALWFRRLTLVALLLFSLDFATTQVRSALYPALEHTEGNASMSFANFAPQPMPAAAPMPAPMAEAADAGSVNDEEVMEPQGNDKMDIAIASSKMRSLRAPQKSEAKRATANAYQVTDPDAKVQTGPGLPDWQWHSYRLVWNGPVRADQPLDLWLIAPWASKLLVVLRLVLLGALLARLTLTGFTQTPPQRPERSSGKGIGRFFRRSTAACIMAACALGLSPILGDSDAQAATQGAKPLPAKPVAAQDMAGTASTAGSPASGLPSTEMLAELRARLTRPADCQPECAEISRLTVQIGGGNLRLGIDLDAAIDSALPIPGGVKQWLPQEARLDGKNAFLLRDDAGTLWVLAPAGRHRLELTGELANRDTVQLSLPRKPRTVDVAADGWDIAGMSEESGAADTLQLTRRIKAGDSTETPSLPPSLLLERRLNLDLVWRVETTVRRLSPLGIPALIEVPLLPGEAVNTAGVVVKDGKVLVNLGAQAESTHWSSSLGQQPTLKLSAAKDDRWNEQWTIAASGLWHITATGIPPIAQASGDDADLAFRPWPGESVDLTIERPKAIDGQTLTIDTSVLSVAPGNRATDYRLQFTARSSRGVDHAITLPEGALLQNVAINGQPRPIRADGRRVVLPLSPGKQTIDLAWRVDQGITTHFATLPIDLGSDNVNHRINFKVPADRWLLLVGGPALGPAILFWASLLILLAAAVGLGRYARPTGLPMHTRHWILLALGLTQVSWWAALLTVAWFFALAQRQATQPETSPRWRFNATQVALPLLTLVMLGVLFSAVQTGLLGRPDMQVAGNGSSSWQLAWYVDRAEGVPPGAWVLSLPLFVYRGLMLAWALWLAWSLLGWLKWGWNAFANGGLWQRKPLQISPPITTGHENVNTKEK